MSSLHRSGWVSLVSISLGGEYLFRFEISKPADEFDIHRPQAPRPAYLFYRPSLRWDWSCFVEDSRLRATDFAPLGVFNVDPSVCLLEHLWLSCAVAQWGIKTQVCSRRKIFKGSECPMMYFVSLNLVLFGTPESQQSRSEVYPKASFNSPWSHTLDFLCFIITFHSSPWDHEYQISMFLLIPSAQGNFDEVLMLSGGWDQGSKWSNTVFWWNTVLDTKKDGNYPAKSGFHRFVKSRINFVKQKTKDVARIRHSLSLVVCGVKLIQDPCWDGRCQW